MPVVHGTYGEDGTIQGFLDAVGLAYIGNGLLSSAICMDKVTSNDIFEKSKLKQAKYKYCYKEDFNDEFIDECIAYVGLPLIVKPSANGSSVGVSRVETKEDFKKAGLEALKYDRKLLVEELIVGQEIELAVLGDSDNIDVSDPAAYITDHVFLDWDAKYFQNQPEKSFLIRWTKMTRKKPKNLPGLATRQQDAKVLPELISSMAKIGNFTSTKSTPSQALPLHHFLQGWPWTYIR